MSVKERGSLTFTDVMELEVGDTIYECEAGMNIAAEVTTAPQVKVSDELRQARWTAVNTQTGGEIDYLLTEGMEHYGPRLYASPQYGRIVGGKTRYPLLGGKNDA